MAKSKVKKKCFNLLEWLTPEFGEIECNFFLTKKKFLLMIQLDKE